jgi:hypothetical protein
MNVRLQYPAAFSAGVWLDDHLSMNTWTIRVDMTTQTMDEESTAVAFDRLKYFLHEVLDSSVLIEESNTTQIKLLTTAGIKVVAMPEVPVDQIVGMMLFAKLNAIMEHRVTVTEVAVGSELGDQVIYLHNDHETLGPFEEPGWWLLPDASTQNVKGSGKKTVWTLKNQAVWKSLDMDWPKPDAAVLTETDTGNTIVFADFGRDDAR